ncbi:MAG TPA: hypothetical protein DCZ03_00080 [Gammaproteobacteria bacterium]|nr:hypothetical protein [Gammaproteobacteria bacterium]
MFCAVCLSFLASAQGRDTFVPGELLIKIRPGHQLEEIPHQQLFLTQAQPTGPTLGLYLIPIRGQQDIEKFAAELNHLPAIHYAEPNYYYESVAPNVSGSLVQHWQKKKAKQNFYQRDFMLDPRLLLGAQFLPTDPHDIQAIFSVNHNVNAHPHLEDLRLIGCHMNQQGRLSSAQIVSCMDYFRSLEVSGMKLLATLNSFTGNFRSQALLDAILLYDLMDIQFISITTESTQKQFPQNVNLANIIQLSFINSNTMPSTPFTFRLPASDVLRYEIKSEKGSPEPTQTARFHRDSIGTRLILNSSPGNNTVQQNMKRNPSLTLELLTSNTVPLLNDEDEDGMADLWEIENRLDPRDPSDAHLDADFDNLTNADEFRLGTSIFSADTDEDSFSDSDEIYFYNSNPLHFNPANTVGRQ